MITFEQLTTAKTSDGTIVDVLDLYRAQGFTTTSWQTGSVELARMMVLAELWALLQNGGTLPLALSVHNDTAEGTALTLLSNSHFRNTRIGAIATQGEIILTGSSGSSEAVSIGDVVVADSVTGVEFRNITGGTIPGSGDITLSFEAEIPGISGNVPNGRITVLSTSIAGVTVANTTGDGSSWVTRAGIDQESDPTLQLRNSNKWGTLGPHGPQSAYKYYALSATNGSGDSVGISKVKVQKPDGTGAFNVYIANATATATAQQVSDVQAYLDTRKSPSATVTVVAATEVPITLAADVVVTRGKTASARESITTEIGAYIDGLDAGGQLIDTTSTGYVLVSEIIAAGMGVDGVTDFSTAALSQALLESEVATVGAITLNITEA